MLVVILVIAGSLARWGSAEESPADGEWEHLVRGAALWSTLDARLSHEDPPLGDAIATIGIEVPWSVTADASWDSDLDAAGIARRSARAHYTEGRAALMSARCRVTWILLAGVLYAYAWGLRLYGFPTAVAAAVLVGFHPALLAHAGYLGEALPSAIAIMVATGELVRHLRSDGGRWTSWGTLPLSLGVALATGHAAWILVPAMLAVVVLAAITRLGARHSVGLALGHALATIGLAILVLGASYGFAGVGTSVGDVLERPEPHTRISGHYRHEMLEQVTPLPSLPRSMPVPLPYAEVFGLGTALAHHEGGDSRAYFAGRHDRYGHWLYFPTLLVTKTPLVVLGLLLVGAVLGRRRDAPADPGIVTLLLVGSLSLLVSMRMAINLGIGPVLHLVALLALLAAIAFGRLWTRVSDRRVRLGLVALLLAIAGTGIATGPRHRSAFNLLVGRAGGAELSAAGDDAGQDWPDFARIVQGERLAPLYVHHGSTYPVLELDHLGVRRKALECRTKPKPGTWVAVRRERLQAARPECFSWRDGLSPTYAIGEHVLVYRMPTG